MLHLLIRTNYAKITLKPRLIDDIQQWEFPLNTGEQATDETPLAKRASAEPGRKSCSHTHVNTASDARTYVSPSPEKGGRGTLGNFEGASGICGKQYGE